LLIPYNVFAARLDLQNLLDSLLKRKDDQLQKIQQVRQERQKQEGKAEQLNDQIAVTNRQIGTLTGEITALDEKLDNTREEINLQNEKIGLLEKKIVFFKDKLGKTLSLLYRASRRNLMEVVITAVSFSEVANEVQYSGNLSSEIGSSIRGLDDSKQELEEARNDLRELEDEYATDLNQQKIQKQGLESQKRYKALLLARTQSEVRQLKKQELDLASREKEVENEITRLIAIYRSQGERVGRPIKKGEVIGYQGNTGYSTGSHLHFTVFIDGDLRKTRNPNDYLNSDTFFYPLKNPIITQGYGMTAFARSGAYRGKPHNGIDMASYPGAPITAAADGTIILDKYFGGYGNAIIIDHGNNLFTLYGHMAK